jgi:hypothetical protein
MKKTKKKKITQKQINTLIAEEVKILLAEERTKILDRVQKRMKELRD